MKVIVTGSAGFIGSHLVDALLKMGYDVLGIDNLCNGNYIHKHKNFTFVQKDIREDLTKEFEDAVYTYHLAALGGVPRSLKEPALYYDVNVGGTFNIIKHFKKSDWHERLIFASSSSVYGDSIRVPQKEGLEGFPLSPYAVTKVLGEKMLQNFNVDYSALRFFNVFGPRQKPIAVIPKWITEKKALIYGDGKNYRDFTYIANVIYALITAKGCLPGVYNIGCGDKVNLVELAKALKLPIEHTHERPGDIKASWANIEKAKKSLYYEPMINWKAGIALTKRFYETNRPSK